MNNRTPDSHYPWTKKWGAGQKALGSAGPSPAFPPRRGSRWLSIEADGIGGLRLGRVGGIELEPGLEIADLGFQLAIRSRRSSKPPRGRPGRPRARCSKGIQGSEAVVHLQ